LATLHDLSGSVPSKSPLDTSGTFGNLLAMPTYEYECAKCKKSFEIVQSMKDDALKTCPKNLCRQKTWGKGPVKRKIGAGAGLIFKGSGFYITDYRSEGYKKSKSDSKASESSSGSTTKSDSAKSDTAKPAAKPAKKES
jgi:putative FmdB family regulatory protein